MSRKERDIKQLTEFACAYCERSKNERPPEWCVRRHEGFDAASLKTLFGRIQSEEDFQRKRTR